MTSLDEDEAFQAAVPLSQRAMSAAARPAPYLDDLNPAQRAAVMALDGPVLMLAGAGTIIDPRQVAEVAEQEM